MTLGTVSVIIPCYNAASYLEECVGSVLSQTCLPEEIILVNNQSTDKTEEIAQQLAKKHKGLIRYTSESKKGAPAARNKGLEMANGDWVQFLDADDLLLPKKLTHQLALAKEKEGDVIVGGYQNVEEGVEEDFLPMDNMWMGLFSSRLGVTSSILWKRETLNRVGGWTEGQRSSQEYHLLFQILKANRVVVVDRAVHTIKRVHKGSISRPDNPEDFLWVLIRLRLEIFDFLKNHQSAYFQKRQYALRIVLLKRLVDFYPYRPGPALNLYQQSFPEGFQIKGSELGRMYRLLFNNLGFSRASTMFGFYRDLLGKRNRD